VTREFVVIQARWHEQLVRFGVPQDAFGAWQVDAAKAGLRYSVIGTRLIGCAHPLPCLVEQLDLLEAAHA